MYNEEVRIEMINKHKELLRIYEDWVGLLDGYLLEQPFPQSLLSHVSASFITRFHKSMLALQLLSISGFGDEAYGVLRLMVEYTSTLKSMINNPDERLLQFMNETHMLCWSTPLRMDLGELSLPVGPAHFNADELLTESCHLTATLLGYTLEINTHDNELNQILKNKLDLLLTDVNEFTKGECTS
ncbi:hypothetical protein H1230_12830 [Paenibacillus sp. 19GGS1-52]|uniref:hypothetical protein n=1 Tax=Paenibacillus sp. 19GGS1-52 TaxID=2758563 RepID=UPI001EFBC318|nr:hypothetical protein [Paenibacillus sp. 19GGS1-52]ULO09573.1 hypothetical protein H1230_12830 [Paenibacillus sp. 19GGS1-52]